MSLLRSLSLALACVALATTAASQVVLDTFNAGSTTGAVRAGTSWVNNVTTSATTISVGGTARDDNGWGATGQSINASNLNFLSVTAQRDTGHAAASFVIQFEDRNLNTQVFSVSATAFATGSLSQIQIPLTNWSITFDRSQITSWSIGGGTVGTTAFRMTFDHLALTATSDPSTPTAPAVTGNFGTTTRSFGESASFTVNATGSTPFTYQWLKNNVALAGATSATLTLASLVATDAGTYTCTVANSAGSVTSGAFTLVVNATPATISLGNLAQTYTGTARIVTATTSPANLPVTLNYAGSTTAPTNAGSYAVVATIDHPNYSGRAEGTLVVARAPQSITFAALPTSIPIGTPITLSATSTANQAVSYTLVGGSAVLNSNTLTPQSAAPITVRATVTGNINYQSASVDFSFTTTKQNQSITFAAFTPPSGNDTLTLNATATSNLPVQFSVITGPAQLAGATVSVTGSGLVIIRASQPGNDTFNAAPDVDRAVVVTGPAPAVVAPTIARAPSSQTVTVGGPLNLAADVVGTAPFTYQWFKDNVALAGATGAVFTIARTTTDDTGSYHVQVANSAGNARSAAAVIVIADAPAPTSRLANFSTRARAANDDQVAIAGFVISGTTPKQVLIRAVGPALGQFGVADFLPAPSLELFDHTQRSLARNIGWSNQTNSAAVAAAATQVGAFKLDANTPDSALLATLAPGAYTAVISASDRRAGVGLIEVYDLSAPAAGQQIANLSIRATAGTDADTLIVGIVVQGTGSRRMLVRAVGPGLGQFGVSGFLARPQLAVLRDSTELARNVGWSTATNAAALAQVANERGAFPLAAGSADSAVLIELAPGNYTAQVSGVSATTGVALVEVYEAP